MDCAVCGTATEPGTRFCPVCGALVALMPGEASMSTPVLLPSYDPATRSTAVLGARRPARGADRATGGVASATWSGGRSPRVALLLIALSLLLAFGAIPFLVRALPHARPTSTSTICAQGVDPVAAAAISHATLASAVQTGGHAFEPAAPSAAFAPGQPIYATFVVASNTAGRLDARFCVDTTVIAGTLAVPAGSLGHSGEFIAHLPTKSVARRSGVVVLLWNGHVAARLLFRVS